MDYYRTLGINKTATQDEIKRAYKKLAMQHHPDQGGDADQFKKITEAYETLKDPQKRKQYDQPQNNNFNFKSQNFANNQNPFSGTPFEDLFSNFRARTAQNIRARDITVRVIIDLKDIITGKTQMIQYRLKNGKIETVNVEIPAGARQGDTIKYEGLGDVDDPRIPRGNLFVKIHIKEPRGWTRDGNNLLTKRSVNVFDILLGCVIVIETMDGKKVNLNIPKGTKSGTILSITGYGIPDLRTKRKGNLYVQIDIEIPKIEDDSVLSMVKQIKDRIKE